MTCRAAAASASSAQPAPLLLAAVAPAVLLAAVVVVMVAARQPRRPAACASAALCAAAQSARAQCGLWPWACAPPSPYKEMLCEAIGPSRKCFHGKVFTVNEYRECYESTFHLAHQSHGHRAHRYEEPPYECDARRIRTRSTYLTKQATSVGTDAELVSQPTPTHRSISVASTLSATEYVACGSLVSYAILRCR